MSTRLDVLQNFIDGETVPSAGETEAILNPATGEELGRAPITSAEEVDGAVSAARRAFDGWSQARPRSARRRCWSSRPPSRSTARRSPASRPSTRVSRSPPWRTTRSR
jgi:hypothetical protein